MTDGPILAATAWPSNAAMIADVHALGYLRDDDDVLDMTYGRGKWWSKWSPANLATNDIDPDTLAAAHEDFRALPCGDATFDAVIFDPPYVCIGGRKTTGLGDYHARYGMLRAPHSPAAVQQDINDGVAEAARIVKPGGVVLVKCQDYISSGSYWPGTYATQRHAETLDLELIDRLEHVGPARPQPPGRRQVHARRNLSTLLVFRRPR